MTAHIADQQAQLEARRQEAAQLGQRMSRVNEQLGAAREHRSGLLSRQKLLKDLEAKREGVSEGVKSVLRQRDQKFKFVRGLVVDLLRVDVEHAHAIEAALDGRDQWLVTDDSAAAVAAREAMEDLEGRVNFVCSDRLADRGTPDDPYDWNRHEERLRLAADLVRVEPGDRPVAQQLLGRTAVVDDLGGATTLHALGPTGWRFVTLAGELIEADGTLRAGPLTAAMGLISRRSELDALTTQLGEVDGRIDLLTRQMTEGSAEAKSLEERQNVLRNEVYRSNSAKVELTSRISQNDDQQKARLREHPVLDRELEQLAGQAERLVAEEASQNEKRAEFDAELAERQKRVDALSSEQKHLAEELRQSNERLTAGRVEVGQMQEKQLACRQHVQRQTAAKAELSQQVERLARAAEAAAARCGSIESEQEAARAAEAALTSKLADLAERVKAVAAGVAESGESVKVLGSRVEQLRAVHQEIEQALHGLDKRNGETKVRLETLIQRTTDELQLDLPAKYQSLAAAAEDGTPGAGYIPSDIDWEAVGAEIKQLREKIQRLGNVNLDAIGEQEELETREQFLSTQVNDLTESKRQLEELIETINTESGLRFEQTFNAVREHFQVMFRKLFGGGKADIFLETEVEEKRPVAKTLGGEGDALDAPAGPTVRKVDILDAGIEIIAHPPGKKPVSISQLSGGEKTMTCVALLMSIFKSKPSPFCILDEVDAALDEANNQRFNLIVQEFLEQSQFIVITHSKRTMQIADVLYGVTMQEQGVSKRVAVKFDQVGHDGRISETAAA